MNEGALRKCLWDPDGGDFYFNPKTKKVFSPEDLLYDFYISTSRISTIGFLLQSQDQEG